MIDLPGECYKDWVKLLFITAIAILGAVSCAVGGRGANLDTTPPSIGNIRVEDISMFHADLAWTTSEPAATQIECGTTTDYGMTTPLAENLVTTHSVTITGLESDVLHHFRVRAKDAAGNEAISEDHNFTTGYHPSTSM